MFVRARAGLQRACSVARALDTRVTCAAWHARRRRSAREKMIDANFLKLQKWRKAFESSNGRPATKADIMLADPEIKNLALRMGELF